MNNRTSLLFALLLLLFLVSTSAGFANVSSIQDQLRGLQLKIIGEKLKLIQEGILGITPTPVEVAVVPPPAVQEMTPEQLADTLQKQIRVLEGIIGALKPQAMAQEAARIEQQIAEVQKQVADATGDELSALQERLSQLTEDQIVLEQSVRKSLEDSLKYNQALLIRDQIKALQEKVDTLPRTPTGAAAPVPPGPSQSQLEQVQDSIDSLRLKIVQAQIQAIREKVAGLAR
ncbi:MAG: hypothetical protein HYT41_02075 [Candidatus Sungbacteria bacterium]|nr:hypothetical protein [Candidatus Sungbacteria bacterium]